MGDMDARDIAIMRDVYGLNENGGRIDTGDDLADYEEGQPDHCPVCSEQYEMEEVEVVHGHLNRSYKHDVPIPHLDCEAWQEGYEDFRKRALDALKGHPDMIRKIEAVT